MVKGYLTTGEAAHRLGVTTGRIRQMILEGKIANVEKAGRDNMIPEKEIAKLEDVERKAGRPRKAKSVL